MPPRTVALSIGRWLLIAAAVVLVLSNFNFGFRVTADQLQDTYFAITHTPAEWLAKAWEIARYQGRIGHVLIYLLMYAGGYFGDVPVYPLLCIGIFVTIAGATFGWAQSLAETRIALPLFGVFLALVPVGLYHWLPNAYPMQFLPLAVGLTAKAVWFGRPGLRWPAQTGLGLLVLIGALSFESCWAMLAAMAAIETWVAWRYPGHAAGGRLSRAYVVAQWLVLGLSLAVYLGFRLAYPSNYEGNQLPTLDTLGWGVLTTFMHIVTGPSLIWIIVRLVLVMRVDLLGMLGALVVGAGLYLLVVRMVCPTRRLQLVLVAAGVLIAVCVTAPIGFNAKYVEWCSSGHDCTYLDSRLALVGLVIALPFIVPLIVRDERRARLIVAVLAALFGGVGYLANVQWRTELATVDLAETEAKRFICSDPSGVADTTAVVAELLARPVPFHPFYSEADKAAHWTAYITHLRAHRWWLCPAPG